MQFVSGIGAWILVGLAGTVSADEPVTGVWKGTIRGSGEILPEYGIPFGMWLTRSAEVVEGRVFVQGFDTLTVRGEHDLDGRRLELAGLARGLPFQIQGELQGEALVGEALGLGRSFDFEVRRIATRVMDDPPPRNEPANLDLLSVELWAEDIEFLAGYLPQVHVDAFHTITQDEWRAGIDAIQARIQQPSDAPTGLDLALALAELVARVGDAHTGLHWREFTGFDAAPIRFERLADGVFVTGADARHQELLGAELLQIGSRSPARAIDAVARVTAAENDGWRTRQALSNLAIPKLLYRVGVSRLERALPVVCETRDGEEVEALIETDGGGAWSYLPNAETGVPRFRTRVRELYWFETLPDERAVYLAYNVCREDPKRTMSAFLDELFAAFDSIDADRLVIDLRNNTGGSSVILSDQIERIAGHGPLANDGRVIVLIGPTTYSSGMMNAHQLRQAGATLYGEPTGGKPNSYGEVRSFRLPNSGLQVHYSTKYFPMITDADPPAVEPDVEIVPSAAQVFSGQDPVLAAALER